MTHAIRYVIYSNMFLQMRALWARIMDATQVLKPGAKRSTLNEVWLKFEPVTSCHVGL